MEQESVSAKPAPPLTQLDLDNISSHWHTSMQVLLLAPPTASIKPIPTRTYGSRERASIHRRFPCSSILQLPPGCGSRSPFAARLSSRHTFPPPASAWHPHPVPQVQSLLVPAPYSFLSPPPTSDLMLPHYHSLPPWPPRHCLLQLTRSPSRSPAPPLSSLSFPDWTLPPNKACPRPHFRRALLFVHRYW